MKQLTFKNSIFIILAIGLITLAGCSKNDNNNNNNSAAGTTYIQFINTSPASSHSSIYHGNENILSDFYYLLSTGYDGFSNQNLSFHIEGTQTILTTPTLSCEKGKTYSFFLYDSLPHAKYLLIKDSVTTLPSNVSAVKFVNVSPNAGAVSFRISGGATLATNVQYAGTNADGSSTAFIQFDPSTRPTFEVVDASSNVIASFGYPSFVPQGGLSYTLFLSGYVGGTYPNDMQLFWTNDEIVP